MKTGRVISLVLVAGITLLCSFPVFALDSYSYSKTNQDVYGAINYYYSVNAVGSDSSVVANTGSTSTSTSSTVTGSSYVDYNFTVQVTNSSADYYVADYNTDRYQFAIDVNTGNTAFFNLVNWSYMNSVLHYSDNMTVPSISVGTNTGHIVFSWYDVESQIILRPYETRTYSFTIRSTTDFGDGVNYPVTPYTAEGMTYFPSGSSFSLSKKPTSYTSVSVPDTIVDDFSFTGNAASTISRSATANSDGVLRETKCLLLPAYVSSIESYTSDGVNVARYIVDVPVWYFFNLTSNSSDILEYTSNTVFGSIANINVTSSFPSLGYYDDSFSSNGLVLQQCASGYIFYLHTNDGVKVLPYSDNSFSFIRHFRFSVPVDELDSTSFNYSFTSSVSTFTGAFGVVDNEVADTIESVHGTESQYFTDTDNALGNTGLDSYEYDVNQSSGLGLVAQDFTLVWNSLGPINGVIIFSMTLSLALFVLRHRRRI